MIERATILVLAFRSSAAGLAMLLGAVAAFAPANAQTDYPNLPVQLIVPYGAGGVADTGMRIVAEALTARLKARCGSERSARPMHGQHSLWAISTRSGNATGSIS